MPLGIARLTSLQTLTKVIVEGANRFIISDLKGLADLQGRLSIIGLEKVMDPIQAMNANLHQKKDLDVLEMKWSDELDDSRNEMIEYEVLKELRPPPNLKKLKILFKKGTKFPSWIDNPSFDRLTELTICGCRSTHLPTLGLLGSLRKLLVERMREVKSVDFKLLAHNNAFTGIAFPSLEKLEFEDMQGWQKWSNNIDGDHGSPISFPRLHKISIKCCPKLAEVSIGLIPSLRVLHIIGCSKAVFRSMVGLSSSLVELEMWSVEGLTQLHGEDLMHLGAVEEVVIGSCDELRYLWQQDMDACNSLVSLQTLEVYHCKKLVSLAEKEVSCGISMKSLKQVKLVNCETLESYKCPYTVESLMIDCCNSVTSLTFSTVKPRASTLSESIVGDCDSIQPISRLTSLYYYWLRESKVISS